MSVKNLFSNFFYRLYSFDLNYRKFVCWWKNEILKNTQYHIGLHKGEGGTNAVLVETPAQVEQIAASFKNTKALVDHREYFSVLIDVSSTQFLAISMGIGTPPIAIGMEELSIIGIDRFLYIGSCKPLTNKMKDGDFLLVKAAIKEDGTSREYLPNIIPAVADVKFLNKVRGTLQKAGIPYHIGISATIDLDPYHLPAQFPLQQEYQKQIEVFRNGNAYAIDRAAAGVYAVATKVHKPACCILYARAPEFTLPIELIEHLSEIFS